MTPHISYQKLEAKLTEKNIQIRPLFYDVRKHTHLQKVKITDPDVIDISNGCMLPSYPELTKEQQLYIVHCLREIITEEYNRTHLKNNTEVYAQA